MAAGVDGAEVGEGVEVFAGGVCGEDASVYDEFFVAASAAAATEGFVLG